jgi:PAS domain S-box-containing protein
MAPKRWTVPVGYRVLLASLLLVAGAYAIQRYNYLLFHSLAEFLSIAVAVGMFMVFWNARRFVDNGFFLVASTGYLAAASIDLFHTLAYEGMGVFPYTGANLATQLWIAARALQAVSLVAAIFFTGGKVKRTGLLLLGYALALILLLGTIRAGWFPTCYVEGSGLTPFKRISEYVISALLVAALALLVRKRRAFARNTFFLLAISILATVVSELAFTFYVNVYGLSNMIGHLAKIVAFYLVYVALVEVGLRRPYESLFRILKHNESMLFKKSEELRERVKELDCLYGISDLVEKPGATLDEVLQGTLGLLTSAQQFPEAAAARIVLAKREYRTAHYCETTARMTSDLVVHGERCGLVELCYVEPGHQAPEGLLGGEEQQQRLLDSVAERLGRIVERFRAEELLQASEFKFRSLVEQSQDGVTLADEQGIVIEWNRAMEGITGLAAAQTLGRPIWEVQFELNRPENRTEAYRQQLAAIVQEGLRTGQVPRLGRVIERNYVRPDGTSRVIEAAVFAIQTPSGFMLANISRDVTESRQAEKMLRIKDEAMAAAYDAIAMADLAGNLTYVNAAFLRLWGYAREEEVLGRPIIGLWQEPEKAAEIIRLLQPQDNTVGELAARRCDGTPFDAQLAASIVRDAAGQPISLLGIITDVTARKQSEHALQASETRYRRLFETAQDGILILDADTGSIATVNPFLTELLGYSREEVLGKKLWEIGPFRDLAAAHLAFAELQECGYIRYEDLPLETSAGRRIDVEFVSNVYQVDGKRVIQCNIRDITARKQSERQLRQAKEEWERTFDAVPDLIALMDVDHRIVRMNRPMAERLGCTADACVGQPCYLHVHGTEQPPTACPHTLLLQDHQEHTAELHEERLGGDFIVTVSPLWGTDGEFLGSVHIARDITERKRAAAEIESLARFPAENPSPVLRLDSAGTVLYANDSSQQLLQPWGCVPGEPAPQYWRELTAEALATGLARTVDIEISERILSVIAVPIVAAGYVNLYARDITELRLAEEQRRLNEIRLNSLLELSLKAGELSEKEIVEVALEEAERLTGSQIAYLHFVHPDERTIQLVAWSEATKRQCTAVPVSHYPLDQAGIWADCVRNRRPVVHNDYQNCADKKGYPEGHAHLLRHASVPVFDNGRVTLILGVGNKESVYDESDMRQLLLIGSEVMRILRRKRAEGELQTSLREKTVLLQEVHHRVKNNLQVISSLLDMQAMSIQDPQTLQALQDSRNRVRAMAVVHDRLYQSATLSQIGAADYLQSVAGYLYGVYAGRIPPVELGFDIQDIELDLDTAIPCGLIVNELVSNALKYAFPPGHGPGNEIVVSLWRQDLHLRLAVRDNGIGLPTGLDIATAPSLGLRLVDMLTQQLRGQLEISREGGTAFYITFPSPDAPEEVQP